MRKEISNPKSVRNRVLCGAPEMKVLKRQKKSTVRFDEKARREYLTGFQKRKSQRRKKAKLEKLKSEREVIKEAKRKKRTELVEKLKVYGLDKDDESQQEDNTGADESSSTTIYYNHPNHVVIVDTQPSLGTTLKSLAEEESRANEEEEEEKGQLVGERKGADRIEAARHCTQIPRASKRKTTELCKRGAKRKRIF